MKHFLLAGALAAGLGLTACDQVTQTSAEPVTPTETSSPATNEEEQVSQTPVATGPELDLSSFEARLSYMLGLNIGNQFARDEIEVDVAIFTAAFEEALAGQESQLTPEELQATMLEFQTRARERQEQAFQVIAETNAAEGTAFLAENATKDGVVTTESGLQYKVLVEGEGAKPTAADTVTVHYRGTLLDGTVFDSSYDRGQPASFPLSGVIAGWTEGLQLMPVGSKYEFFIPSNMAYGPGGTGRDIGPNATLKFEVELIEIAGQ